MNRQLLQGRSADDTNCDASNSATSSLLRINSRDLFKQACEVEIDHDGRIYRLRLTQLNKLILTA
jgi:hemin uptake protein HemP